MMWQVFSPQSPYKKRARLPAILWTLLIFILCLWPAEEIPQIDVPLADKWTHFVFFAMFSFCWLCVFPSVKPGRLAIVLFISILYGWLIELLQYWLSFLGRHYDPADVLANSLGGLLGLFVFYIFNRIAASKRYSHDTPQ